MNVLTNTLFTGISLIYNEMYENFPKVDHNPWIEYFMEEATRIIVQVYDDEQCERYVTISISIGRRR